MGNRIEDTKYQYNIDIGCGLAVVLTTLILTLAGLYIYVQETHFFRYEVPQQEQKKDHPWTSQN